MKKIFALCMLLFCVSAQASTVVRNTSTTSRDSLVAYVNCLDSLGRPSNCDSFFVMVLKSGTNDVVFKDSGTIGMTGMDSVAYRASATPDGVMYYYHRAVADIDGSGAEGQYVVFFSAQKVYVSGSNNWYTPSSMPFRIENYIKLDSAVYAGKFTRVTDSANRVVWYNGSDTAWSVTSAGSGKPAVAFRNTHATGAAGSNGFYTSSANREATLFTATSASSSSAFGFRAHSASSGGVGFYVQGTGGATSAYSDDATYSGPGVIAGTVLDIQPGIITSSEIGADAIGSSELGATAVQELEAALYAKTFTTTDTSLRIKLIDGTGANPDTVLTRTGAAGDVTLAASQPNYAPLKVTDTPQLRSNIVTALGIPLKPSDTDELRANIIAAIPVEWTSAQRDSAIARILANRDSVHDVHLDIEALPVPLKPSDTDELRANIIAAMPVEWTAAQRDSAIARILANRDSVHDVHLDLEALPVPLKPSDTDELRANIAAAIGTPLKPSDTDELRANIIAAIPNNEVWTAAQRDSLIARQISMRDSINVLHNRLIAETDSALWAAGFGVNSRSTQGFSTNTDTLHIWIGATEIFKVLYWHIGKGPGSVEIDSTQRLAP